MKLSIIKRFVLALFIFSMTQMSHADSCQTSVYYQPKYAKRYELHKTKKGYLLRLKLKANSFYSFTNDKDFATRCRVHYFNDQKAVLASTTGAAVYPFLKLDALKQLKFISRPQYVFSREKLKRVKTLKHPLRAETLLQNKINLLIFDWGNFSLSKLAQMNITAFPLSNFLEPHPLGRAEWLVVFGVLFHKFEESKKTFFELISEYQKLVQRNKKNPQEVLVADFYRGKWVVPSQDSDLMIMLRDAGLTSVISNPSKKPLFLRTEKVLKKMKETGVWFASGKKSNLLEVQNKYTQLKKLKVYSYSARVNKDGAYDYWESGVFRPDLILKDLINIKKQKIKSLYYYEEL